LRLSALLPAVLAASLYWALSAAPAAAQAAGTAQPSTSPALLPAESLALPEISVVGVTPALGTGIPLNQVPSNVQTLNAHQIEADPAQSLTDVLERNIGSVSITNTEGNPFQQDMNIRGFTASPVLGTPQGIAVYQNGARINEPFGDIVLWDLVPTFAINKLQLIPGSDPVFGLNALGGAVTLEMKNGFDFQGAQLDFSAGAFGRRQTTDEYGIQYGDFAAYTGLRLSHEDGWRMHSPSDLVQSFSDIAARGDDYDVGLSLTLGETSLSGIGPTPAQELQGSWDSVFTYPDNSRDRLIFLQARGDYDLPGDVSLQGNAYYRHSGVRITNGNASDFAPCTAAPALLCENVGDPGESEVVTQTGASVPSSLVGNAINDKQAIVTDSGGGSLQLTFNPPLFGLKNTGIVGSSVDFGSTRFTSTDELGTLNGDLSFMPLGVLLGTDEYNTDLRSVNIYYGLYATDTLSITDALSATLAGRLNLAQVVLTDLYGNSLNGNHSYQRFNPSAGLTYQVAKELNFYASYGESNRIPTAAELACADSSQPCRFPAGFIADPALRQVVARTLELGARGQVSTPVAGDTLSLNWSADVYGSQNSDDIIFVSAGPIIGSGFFRNAGTTQRLGGELGVDGTWNKFDFHLSYGFVDATFQSNLTILSPSNPGANADGNIFVKPGDRLPGIPLSSAKASIGYHITDRWSVTLESILTSGEYLRGDEANLQKQLPGYAIFNARTSYQVTKNFELYLEAENILDRRYKTFGIYGDPTDVFPTYTDDRFYTPGQPFGFWGGIRIRF
jgi:iron complex outermembrane receptor protein